MMKSTRKFSKIFAVFLIVGVMLSSFSGCNKVNTEQQSEALVSLESAVNYYKTTKDKLTHWEELVALCAANQADGIGIGWSFLTLPETPVINEYPSSYTSAILTQTIKGEGEPIALAKQLASMQNAENGSFNTTYLNQHVWAMITLNTVLGTDGYDYDHAVEYLLNFQSKDGGFTYTAGNPDGNVDLTGIACVALSPYFDSHKKEDSMKNIVSFFSEKQIKTGGYNGAVSETPSTIAMAIWGLSALNQKLPVTDKGLTPFDALAAYQNEDGSFRSTLDGEHKADDKATREATIALCDIVNDMNTYLLLASDAQNYRIEHISGPAITLTINYPIQSELKNISGPFTVEEGSSVLDALILYSKITETPVVQKSGSVNSIDNVQEQDYGPLSCWLYSLNGQELPENPKDVTLVEGDSLVWTYYIDPAWVAEQERIAAEEAAKAEADAKAAAEEARAEAEAKATEQN